MVITRTRNTVVNFFWGFLNKIATIVFPFIIRTIIIHVLGVKYTGLNGLFTSILSVLSLAELGVGSALSFSMYKPVADSDNKKLCALLSLYRKLYFAIGIVVLVIGLLLLPFIKFFINDTIPDELNIYCLYLIYLSESACSYFVCSYRSSLFNAYHRKHIISNISTVINVLMYVAQIIVIILFENYYLYLILRPVGIALINIVTSAWSKHDYPDIVCEGKLERDEIHEIRKQVCGLMCQRLAFKSRNAFDSIVISAILGLTVVGIYNNYLYIISAVDGVLALIFQSMQSGIGNSVACENVNKNYCDFRRINFLYMFISGICTACLLSLTQGFMDIWVGNDLKLSFVDLILLCALFLCTRLTDTEGAYISATGTWWYCKYIYIIEAATNLVLNVLLGYFLGVSGVVLASILSALFINFVFCGKQLYKHYFKEEKFLTLVIDDFKCCFAITICCALSYFATCKIPSYDSVWLFACMFCLKAFICCLITFLCICLLFFRDPLFQECIGIIKNYFSRRIKK